MQAVKDPMKSKGARLTTEISLPGRFVVYVPQGEGIGVSRRLEDEERTRLKDILRAIKLPKGGLIVRTAAEGASPEDIERDVRFLEKLWKEIQASAKKSPAPSLVYSEAERPSASCETSSPRTSSALSSTTTERCDGSPDT